MKLSVIIPVHDRAELLERCLASVEAQSWRPLQVVVVDDGSSDASAQVALAWGSRVAAPDFEVEVLTQAQAGAASARRAGAGRATGQVLAFFDSDDTMRPDFARAIMEAFASRPGCELVFWKRMQHHAGRSRVLPYRRSLSLATHVVHCQLSTQSCAVSRGLYDRSGGWDPGLPRWNDWELGIRYICSLHGPAVGIGRVLADILVHPDSITGDSFLAAAGHLEKSLMAALAFAATLPDSRQHHLRRLIAYKTAILAALYTRDGDPELGRKTLLTALDLLPDTACRHILKCVYAYTCRGLRGADRWAIPLIVH